MLVYVLLALACGCSLVAEAKMQKITATGITVCNKRRFDNALVELWESDTFDPDDLLATTYANEYGEFSISGQQDEFSSISPYIRISHECNLPEGKENCTRVIDLEVPKDEIKNGVYNLTCVTLDLKYGDEKLECGKHGDFMDFTTESWWAL